MLITVGRNGTAPDAFLFLVASTTDSRTQVIERFTLDTGPAKFSNELHPFLGLPSLTRSSAVLEETSKIKRTRQSEVGSTARLFSVDVGSKATF